MGAMVITAGKTHTTGWSTACEFFPSVMIGPVLCTASCVYVNVSVSKQINRYNYTLSQFLTNDDREKIVHKNIVLQKLLTKVRS